MKAFAVAGLFIKGHNYQLGLQLYLSHTKEDAKSQLCKDAAKRGIEWDETNFGVIEITEEIAWELLEARNDLD